MTISDLLTDLLKKKTLKYEPCNFLCIPRVLEGEDSVMGLLLKKNLHKNLKGI